jgi:integrase
MLPDGLGLYLQVGPTATKSWLFRYARGGVERQVGLGAAHAVTLVEAREKARQCRNWLADGLDPLLERQALLRSNLAKQAKQMSFSECARKYIDAHSGKWKNPKHRDQWVRTIDTYANPVIGELPVAAVDTTLVLRVLEPIWKTKTETATRLRSRLERVLAWATVRELRTGDNPARWHNHLDQLLAAPSKARRVIHHSALPYADVPEFLTDLRSREGVAARALEFTILTAARTGEVIGARRREFDLDAKLWVIPKERMKAGKEHRVPLSPPVMALLKKLPDTGDFVFPGHKEKTPLSNMAMLTLLKRMDRQDITVHGFRSSFRDWAAECTNYPREVCELALAHGIEDKVEEAYRRGDLFAKRRKLMSEWAAYCAKPASSAVVFPIRRARK